jgi:hypothetical protein
VSRDAWIFVLNACMVDLFVVGSKNSKTSLLCMYYAKIIQHCTASGHGVGAWDSTSFIDKTIDLGA